MADLDFKAPELSDREWVVKLLAKSGFRGCLYTFGNNFAWKDIYNVKICRYGDFYLLRNNDHASDAPRFLYPAGEGNVQELVAVLKEYCAASGVPLLMTANRECTDYLKSIFPEIVAEPDRDGFDYVYNSADLAELKGRRFHGKRNHLNRFFENNWRFEQISPDNIKDCKAVLAKWLAEDADNREKQEEAGVTLRGLDNFSQLQYTGGLLTVDGEPQAFTFGEPSAADTFVVHVEKALLDYQGAYAAVNCEFAKTLASQYRFINREEDTGSEGLRKAKLSYHPAFFEEKYLITFGGKT